MIFRPASPDLVRESFQSSAKEILGADNLDDIRAKLIADRKDARYSYIGGPSALEALIRRPGEGPEKWTMRQRFFRNVRVVKPIADTFASLIYGDPYPRRSWWIGDSPPDIGTIAEAMLRRMRAEAKGEPFVDEIPTEDSDSVAYSAWAHQVYNENNVRNLFREMLAGRVDRNGMWRGGALVDGAASIKIYPRRQDKRIAPDLGDVTGLKFALYSIEDAIPIPDPDDSDFALAVLEPRKFGDKTAYRQWGIDGYRWVDASMDPIQSPTGIAPTPLDLGMPPFAFFGDGSSIMGDAVLDQRAAINMASARDFVMNAQGFAVPVVQGKIKNKPQQTAGGPKVAVSEIFDFLWLDDNSSFNFVAPNPPLGDWLEAIKSHLGSSYKSHNLPDDLIRESSGAEQPWSMILRWLPTLSARKSLLPVAHAFERDAAKLMAAYGETYSDEFNLGEFSRDDAGFDVVYADHPIPTNPSEFEATLRARLDAGLLLLTEYLYQLDPELSAQELAEKAFAIEQDKERRTPAQLRRTPEASDEDEDELDDTGIMAEEAMP